MLERVIVRVRLRNSLACSPVSSWPNRVHLRYGPAFRLQSLLTPPHDDARTIGYRRETCHLERTFTSLATYTLSRTRARFIVPFPMIWHDKSCPTFNLPIANFFEFKALFRMKFIEKGLSSFQFILCQRSKPWGGWFVRLLPGIGSSGFHFPFIHLFASGDINFIEILAPEGNV